MSAEPLTSPAALFGRIFWMIVGPIGLAVLALRILQERTGWFTVTDMAYFLVLGGMLLGRWVEFRSGGARTGMGEPATSDDLRRYLMGASLLGLGLWALANLVGNHWLSR
jgi:hypothetical protein